jgi:hypothetical protein
VIVFGFVLVPAPVRVLVFVLVLAVAPALVLEGVLAVVLARERVPAVMPEGVVVDDRECAPELGLVFELVLVLVLAAALVLVFGCVHAFQKSLGTSLFWARDTAARRTSAASHLGEVSLLSPLLLLSPDSCTTRLITPYLMPPSKISGQNGQQWAKKGPEKNFSRPTKPPSKLSA